MRDTWENKMRVSILLIAVTGFLAVVPAKAQSGRGQTPDHVNAGADLFHSIGGGVTNVGTNGQ